MESFAALVNPWSVSPAVWVAGVLGKEGALQLMDLAVDRISRSITPLPSRTGPKPVPQRPLDGKDMLYLSCNSVIECIFVSHLAYFFWYSALVTRPIDALGLLNGPFALCLVLLLNDMFYAPTHRLLHTPFLYKWIHKHHHRVTYPQRGNVDARNEHPVEQIIAMALWFSSLALTAVITGLHAGVIPLHMGIMVVGACFNHTGCDLSLSMLGVEFSVRAHEMHHRKPNTNFGQLVMVWDKLMGTYAPYASCDA